MKTFVRTLLGLAMVASTSSAYATLVGYDSCSITDACLIAPDQAPIPNPIVKDPNNGLLLGWNEVQNLVLSADLFVDRVADPTASFVGGAGTLGDPYFIKAGTTVSSHYFQWDPAPEGRSIQARIRFDSEIFAFITATRKLFDSDAALGLAGFDYADFGNRGLESGDTTDFAPDGDNRLVDINWAATSPGDWTRLITAFSPAAEPPPVPVPEPGPLFLMLTGLLVLALRGMGRAEV